jgi:DNA-binding SARP family transcriptional activator/TolB-like protein
MGRNPGVIWQVTGPGATESHMIQLTVLGGVELRRDDGSHVGSVLNQPRRLALLVYLALESGRGGVQRDRLLGVFWPDLPQEQARQSLRTALHFLRRSLGPGAIGGEGNAARLEPGVVSCDAAAFQAALRANDPETALRHYQGDLLPGFFLDDGPPEFEKWLEATRGEMRRAAAGAAWSLAEAQEQARNPAGAGAWARRAAQLCQGDEAATRRTLQLLGRIGDRAGALALYEELKDRLRSEFDATPSPETDDLLAGLLEAPPETQRADHTPAPRNVAAEHPPVRRLWRLRASRTLGGAYSAAVTMLLVVGFYSLWGLNRGAPETARAGGVTVIQVEEIRDFSPDDGGAALAGALTMEITGRLSEVDAVQVIAQADAREAPRAPQATYLVRGGLIRSGSSVQLTAMLLDGASGATLERITVERTLADAATTTTELAESVSRRLLREVGRSLEDRGLDARAPNRPGLGFLRASARDLALADSLRSAGVRDAAEAAFEAADSLLALAQAASPRWAEPHTKRAELAYRRMWLHLRPAPDPITAGEVIRTGIGHAEAALAMAPDDPAAHELRGLLDYWHWRLRAAGSDEANTAALVRAETHLRRATELDAGRGRAWSALSALHESRGDFAAANLAARRAHRADPYLENAIETVVRLFSTSLEVGDTAAARRWCEELGRRAPESWLPGFCVLEQMAWLGPGPAVTPDSVRRIVAVTAAHAAHPIRARIEMVGAVALAHLRAPGTATAIESARASAAGTDPYLLVNEAWARLVLGEAAVAAALLAEVATLDPGAARSALLSRRFAGLERDARFEGILALRR